MEQQAKSIFEVDANLPERLAGSRLLCMIGGIIGKTLWLFPSGSCKGGEMKLLLESKNLPAVDSVCMGLLNSSLSHCGTFSVG